MVLKDSSNERLDVSRFPLKLLLKILNLEAVFFKPANQCIEADVIWLLCVFHSNPLVISAPICDWSVGTSRMPFAEEVTMAS